MHVDTGHNFPETIQFRDDLVKELGAQLIVGSVQRAIDDGRVAEERGKHATRNELQITTLLDAIEENDRERAMNKLISEIHRLTGCFLSFLGGFLVIFLQQYPDFTKEELIMPDLPLIDDVKLPYFVHEPIKESALK